MGDLQSQISFQNNTNTLFVFFTLLTFALMLESIGVETALTLSEGTGSELYSSIAVVMLLITSCSKTKPKTIQSKEWTKNNTLISIKSVLQKTMEISICFIKSKSLNTCL